MSEFVAPQQQYSGFKRWLFEGQTKESEGPHGTQTQQRHQHSWWQVMCLTGVDYFSTLGYQPGIAFLAAGMLSPIATCILVMLTLFGALPIYSRVAAESPHGEGSISMLANLLSRWKGKLFVLILLGFVATDFIITITLSAADATAHVLENPYVHQLFTRQAWNIESHTWAIGVTLLLVALLGAVFLKGFKEAIGIAVFLVGVYLLLNMVVVGRGLYEVLTHPQHFPEWTSKLMSAPAVHGNPFLVIGLSLLLFPKLALGLSGFETGVAVMPLVKGDESDTEGKPQGRVRNTRKLLVTAALIMSVFLISSSIVTTLIIPEAQFRAADTPGFSPEKGAANGRALAYLAHSFLGDNFGTLYDLSTICILWFAGASAMAGLLNIVPRYLPRYGMAPDWTRATRPLVLVYTAIAFAVTVIFRADVDAQGGAYATGVLVLMSSAAIAVSLSAKRNKGAWLPYVLIALIFCYTTVVNVIERPEGIKIASFFIGAIIFTSLISRIWRTTELRVEKFELDETAQAFIDEASKKDIRIIANRCDSGDKYEYQLKEKEKRADNHIPASDAVLFLEVTVCDASAFTDTVRVRGVKVDGYKVLRAEGSAVPNSIAAFLLHLRDRTGKIPHVYFGWTEGNPLLYLFKYIAFGEGDTAPVTHEVLRQAEVNPERRPVVHVGG